MVGDSGLWHALAEAAAPASVPAFNRARQLTATVTGAVAEGDAGDAERAAAAKELWTLHGRYAMRPPLDTDHITAILVAMSGTLEEIFSAERAAVHRLRLLAPPRRVE